jgi:tryptophanase
MNHHFTTARAHVLKKEGLIEEFIFEEGWQAQSECPFKGDVDVDKLRIFIEKTGRENIAFMRMEAGTNLIGGQPVSLENFRKVGKLCRENKIKYVLDASLLADNIYFNKIREAECKDMDIKEIMHAISKEFDIIYFSARKITCARGGGMCFRHEEDYLKSRDLTPLYEGFLTYGGMSIREVEAMAVGMKETLDFDMISQGPIFIAEMTRLLTEQGVPMVTPSGGLGVHIDCAKFLPHVPPNEYPGGALHAALYLAAGIRGTERGTLSEDRDEDGNEVIAKMELLRLALPRRVFTLSQVHFAVDRILWLYENRDLIGGLAFEDEPKMLRFFFGKLKPIGDWQEKLVKQFRADFGDGL